MMMKRKCALENLAKVMGYRDQLDDLTGLHHSGSLVIRNWDSS